MGDPDSPNYSAWRNGDNPRSRVDPPPRSTGSQRSTLLRILNTPPTPTTSYSAATAGSDQLNSNPHVPPTRWVFGEVDPLLEDFPTLEQQQLENLRAAFSRVTQSTQPQVSTGPDTSSSQSKNLETPTQPWAVSGQPPTSMPNRIETVSPQKTPRPQVFPGRDRNRTPTAGWFRDKTPVGVPDPMGSGKHVIQKESYVVPRSSGSRRQHRAPGASASEPSALDAVPESELETMPQSELETVPKLESGIVSIAGPELRAEHIDLSDMGRTLLSILWGSLEPSVRADRLSKIEPPWAPDRTSGETTRPQTEQPTPLDQDHSSTKVDSRIKPAWILGTITPSKPAKLSALMCSLGTYVMRQITDDRYGPASSSSVQGRGEGKPSFKERACFVTFQDGPHVYVAPILGAPKKKTRRPFLTEDKSVWDWWLPVTWFTRHPAQDKQPAPGTPSHPRELEDPEMCEEGAPFAKPNQPGRRRRIRIEYEPSVHELKPCFIWSGDPGDRVSRLPQEARMAHPQVRYLAHREIYEELFVWWNELWEAKIEPPRPGSEMAAE